MRFSSGVNAANKRFWQAGASAVAVFAVLLAVTAGAPLPARAQGDTGSGEVQVHICSGSSKPDMYILAPGDGTVFTANTVPITVATIDLAQVELYVNDRLLTTVILGESAMDFEAALSLLQGTQTIKLVGYDLCNRVISTQSLGVTVRLPAAGTPAVQQAPRVIDDILVHHEAGADRQEDEPAADGSSSPATPPGSADGGVAGVPPGELLFNWLNPGPTFAGLANFARAIAGVAGAILMAYGPASNAVAQQAMQYYLARQPGTKLQKKRFASHNFGRFQLAAHGAGIVLVLGMFVV